MDIILDLGKALNFGKLVQKQVQVRGENGKVFTRMQWVSPEQASTGHGVRHITSTESYHQALSDGIHKHPEFNNAMSSQGVHMHTHNFDDHPTFHLPETEGSAKKFLSRKDNEGEHVPHEGAESIDKPNHSESMAMHKYDAHPEIHRIKDSISEIAKGAISFRDKVKRIATEITKHEDTLHHHVRDYIEQDDVPDHVKNIQKRTLEEGDVQGRWSVMSMHPHVLSHAINSMLGDRAQEFRDAARGELTINFGNDALEGVKAHGYIASTPESYINRNMGESALQRYKQVINSTDDDDERLEKINSLFEDADARMDDDGLYWGDIHERLSAEKTSIGLSLTDPKPTYVALNAGNSPEGGAIDYGDHFLSIKKPEEFLKHCTATVDDTFYETSSVPKVWGMDHLVDMMVLKAVSRKADKISSGSKAKDIINSAKGVIPIEVQYHHQSIPRDMYNIKEYKE